MESLAIESQLTKTLIQVNKRLESGQCLVDISLEPDQLDEFGSACRLNDEEFCETINSVIELEQSDWHELRMKDQINMTRDAIIEATMLKYVKETLHIAWERYYAKDMNYVKRYDPQGKYLGEAIVITIMVHPSEMHAI